MTLTTQLAEDAEELCQGTEVLVSTMENTAYKVLSKICEDNNITELSDKINIAEELFCRVWGLGRIKFTHVGEFSASVEVLHSHIDSGWIRKMKNRNKPVGYINRGYIQGALAVINNVPAESYESEESETIVSGAKKGTIRVWRR
jgi:predicted hydrocarbon binding protein